MTVQEFIAELEHCKKEASAYKHQMEINLDYCEHYKIALIAIAGMCGWKSDPKPSCIGIPEDIDEIAIRVVREIVDKNKTQLCQQHQ